MNRQTTILFQIINYRRAIRFCISITLALSLSHPIRFAQKKKKLKLKWKNENKLVAHSERNDHRLYYVIYIYTSTCEEENISIDDKICVQMVLHSPND